MAEHDPFSQGVEAPTDDPFETEGQSDFQQGDDPFAEGDHQVTQEPVEGRPIVDAEGNVVGGESSAGAAPASSDTPTPPQQESPAARDAAAPATSQETASPSTASATPETPSPAPPSDAEPVAVEEPAAAAPRAEVNEKGEVIKRPYRLLTPDGDGKWTEVHWYEKQGKMVAKGTPGAKKQTQCLVHSKDAALRVGFRAMGSPPGGVKLVALADKWFAVKHVAPEVDPEPRMRLKIS